MLAQPPARSRLAALFESLGEIDRPVPTDRADELNLQFESGAFAILDHDVLECIVARLATAQDLAALGSTCRPLSILCACTYPGIKLQLFPHQKASLAFMRAAEASAAQRGGILADEPGTGKTVTVIALLCKSAGLRTVTAADAAQSRVEAAEKAWTHLALPYKRELVYSIFREVRRRTPDAYALFADSGREAAAQLAGYTEVVLSPPPDFSELKSDRTIRALGSRAALDAACQAVPRAASAYWGSAMAAQSHPDGPAAAADLAASAADLGTAVDAALASHRPEPSTLERPNASRPSGATLIVVPRPLLPHWREQLKWHVHEGGLGGRLLVDGEGGGAGGGGADGAPHPGVAGAAGPAPGSNRGRRGGGATLALQFSADQLAAAAVVITTFERLSLEQRHATSSGVDSVLNQVASPRMLRPLHTSG